MMDVVDSQDQMAMQQQSQTSTLVVVATPATNEPTTAIDNQTSSEAMANGDPSCVAIDQPSKATATLVTSMSCC
jgi:hypothetical protein